MFIPRPIGTYRELNVCYIIGMSCNKVGILPVAKIVIVIVLIN